MHTSSLFLLSYLFHLLILSLYILISQSSFCSLIFSSVVSISATKLIHLVFILNNYIIHTKFPQLVCLQKQLSSIILIFLRRVTMFYLNSSSDTARSVVVHPPVSGHHPSAHQSFTPPGLRAAPASDM